MNALVLAAGKSTRIASVSGGLPKPLLEVGGRPVVARALEWLGEFGFRDVLINLHYRPGDIRGALGDGSRFGVRITYAFEPEILGTAGAFRALAANWTGTTLVVYGDNLMWFDLSRFAVAHRDRGAEATVALFDADRHVNSRIAGSRVMLASDGRVASFAEAAAAQPRGRSGGLVNAGAYLLEPNMVAAIEPGFQDFGRDVFPPLAAAGRLHAHVMEPAGYCLGLDTPESLRVAEELISTKQVALA